MAVRLFVGNLPYDATDDEIRQHFSSVGNLSYVSIPLDRETGKKRGFAFVEFADPQQAQEAIRKFNNQPFKGRPLAVNEARAREAGPRPAGGFRPAPGPRPGGPPMRGPSDFADPAGVEPRSDRPARKNFGPDAKPARNRSQRFKPESGKKAFKEKFTGQIFGAEDEDEAQDIEVDNFATGLDEDEKK
ncbi:MAG TPA: RNA-binding protein [Terriglobia bacterium]|nr:RNA-binding protein [Terriglobia bacterium]